MADYSKYPLPQQPFGGPSVRVVRKARLNREKKMLELSIPHFSVREPTENLIKSCDLACQIGESFGSTAIALAAFLGILTLIAVLIVPAHLINVVTPFWGY